MGRKLHAIVDNNTPPPTPPHPTASWQVRLAAAVRGSSHCTVGLRFRRSFVPIVISPFNSGCWYAPHTHIMGSCGITDMVPFICAVSGFLFVFISLFIVNVSSCVHVHTVWGLLENNEFLSWGWVKYLSIYLSLSKFQGQIQSCNRCYPFLLVGLNLPLGH